MKLFTAVLNFYLNSSVHVAFSVYALIRVSELYFGLPHNKSLSYFAFFGTITGYNFIKYASITKIQHQNLSNNLKLIQIFSIICFLFFVYYAIQLKTITLLFALPLAVLTLLYALPFLNGFQKNLRSVNYLKVIIVSLVWSGFTVVLPVCDAQLNTVKSICVLLMFAKCFLFVTTLILPFEIRDVENDIYPLQTIPKKIGVRNTKIIGLTMLFICVFLEFLTTDNINFRNVFIAICIVCSLLLLMATKSQSVYYSSL
ncbi:MAG: hypothetical protein ACK5H1_09720, partial [Tenacibaculum sp.]